MSRTFLYLSSSTLALTLLSACQPSDDPANDAGTEETGDGDGDPTTGDGDGDPTTGDGDGDPTTGDGDGDGEPEPDTDMDGVGDSTDNCPELANPNQRDFDGNGAGNVCDVQVFTTVSGTLDSVLWGDGYDLGECELPLALEVSAGEVRIQLDDDAAVAAFELVNLEFANVPQQQCGIVVLEPMIGIEGLTMANSGDAFPVSVAHSPADHDAGTITGTTDPQHPVLMNFTLAVQSTGGMPESTDYSIDTALPVFTANVSDAGAMGSLSWDDAALVLAADMFTTVGQVQGDIPFELRGLVGTLDLAP